MYDFGFLELSGFSLVNREGSATPDWPFLGYAVLARGLTDGILSAVRSSTADSGTVTTAMLSPTALKTSRA